jgi:hypothetical protein
MLKEKFSHLLLFNGNFKDLVEFSLADFLLKPSLLTSITYLREALDNVELVYRCVMGDIYVGISSSPKDFLRNNVRILSTRSFDFVRNVFEAGFIRFQMEMRSRDVSTGAAHLNRSDLVIVLFRDCFSFNLEAFSRDEEDMFKVRQAARQNTRKPVVPIRPPTLVSVKSVSGGSKVSHVAPKIMAPCITHLVNALGISSLGGRTINPCAYGSLCTFEHLSVPLSTAKRGQIISFINKSKSAMLRTKVDRDLVLSKI